MNEITINRTMINNKRTIKTKKYNIRTMKKTMAEETNKQKSIQKNTINKTIVNKITIHQ